MKLRKKNLLKFLNAIYIFFYSFYQAWSVHLQLLWTWVSCTNGAKRNNPTFGRAEMIPLRPETSFINDRELALHFNFKI